MAMKTPTRVAGGDYLDLRELCGNEPHGVLCLFRIVEFLPGEPAKRGNTYPVRADVLICSGDRAGEVVLANAEGFKYAPSNALRGLSVKSSDEGEAPKNEPGDELPYIVSIVDKPGLSPFVGLDPAEGEARKIIEELREQMGGDNWGYGEQDAPAAAGAAAPAAPAATPIGTAKTAAPAAAAPAGGSRPWQRAG